MRASFAVVVLMGCFAFGCDDDTTVAAQPDLSVKVNPDMTMVVGTKHCLALVTCAQGCTGAGAAACQQACAAQGDADAQAKYQAVGACAIAGCTATPDGGGAKPCSSATDSSATCQTCISDTAQSSLCMTQLGACLQDT